MEEMLEDFNAWGAEDWVIECRSVETGLPTSSTFP
jgi:hypothetical protein